MREGSGLDGEVCFCDGLVTYLALFRLRLSKLTSPIPSMPALGFFIGAFLFFSFFFPELGSGLVAPEGDEDAAPLANGSWKPPFFCCMLGEEEEKLPKLPKASAWGGWEAAGGVAAGAPNAPNPVCDCWAAGCEKPPKSSNPLLVVGWAGVATGFAAGASNPPKSPKSFDADTISGSFSMLSQRQSMLSPSALARVGGPTAVTVPVCQSHPSFRIRTLSPTLRLCACAGGFLAGAAAGGPPLNGSQPPPEAAVDAGAVLKSSKLAALAVVAAGAEKSAKSQNPVLSWPNPDDPKSAKSLALVVVGAEVAGGTRA